MEVGLELFRRPAMVDTSIEWTDVVWNPTTGCDRVSAGCDHCYALTMAGWLKAKGSPKYQNDGDPRTSGPGFGVAVHPEDLELPSRWRKPRMVFVNSMSDLFHEEIPDGVIARVFSVMAQASQHTFQILTKRHARMRALISSDDFLGKLDRPNGIDEFRWPLPNVWLGVSVEDQRWADIRVPALLDTPAAVRFLSCEPLLGPVDLVEFLDCEDPHVPGFDFFADRKFPSISWVIVGGESGPNARPMDLGWARSLVRQCQAAGVPVFVKQLGSVWAREHDRWGDRKGGDPAAWPADLQVREYPTGAVHV